MGLPAAVVFLRQAVSSSIINIVTYMAKIEELNYNGAGNGNASSSSAVNEKETYSVYCRGLVLREESDKDSEMIKGVVLVVGIGVVICDSTKNMIFELSLSKPMVMKNVGTEKFGLETQLEALIEGLNAAKQLGIRKLYFFCKGRELYNFVSDFSLHVDKFNFLQLCESYLICIVTNLIFNFSM